MEAFTLIVGAIQSIGIIITLIISIQAIRQNTFLFNREKKSDILTQKRSSRIDKLRELSSIILSEGELKLLGETVNISNLVYATNHYSSLLQYFYQYIDDVNLITTAHQIERMIVDKDCNNCELRKLMNKFYFANDQYVSVEFSRVSAEIINQHNEYSSINSQQIAANEQKQKVYDNYREIEKRNEEIFKNF